MFNSVLSRPGHRFAGCTTALTLLLSAGAAQAGGVAEAFEASKATANFRLRYETVDQDNGLKDAQALTLRSLVGLETGTVNGFSAKIELEDTRIVGGQGDYASPPNGYNTGEYSVIADPEHTELDQGYVQYKSDVFTMKVGRQVITHDGHRHVGHVGWRQDRLTFDAATFTYAATKDITLSYSYIGQRNMIFGEDADADSSDHLLNAAVKTPIGKLSLYSYQLERDDVANDDLDTYGARLAGDTRVGKNDSIKVLYVAEYASQSKDTATDEMEADYTLVELGAVLSGITAKVGQEVLGSDDSLYGFATPLATLHKFNGWSDQFLATPATGLEDSYVSLGGSIAGVKIGVTYHEFEADEGTATVSDLGEELDVVLTRKLGKNYSIGLKYADYDAGDVAAGKVDTEKLWFWLGASF